MPRTRTRALALVGLLLPVTSLQLPLAAHADDTGSATGTTSSASPGTTGNPARGADGIVLEGRVVTGGTPTDSAPLPWGDSTSALFGSQASLNYQVTRSIPNSTLRVSVVAATGSDGGEIAVEAHPNNGATCPSSSDWMTSGAGLLAAEIVLTPDGDCGGLEPFRIEVTGNAPERGLPFLLRVTQEPEVSSYGAAGTTLTSMSQAPPAGEDRGSVIGGVRFSNAPVVTAGRWRSELVPGETRLYRIPLTYGQAAQVGVSFDELSEGQLTDLDTSSLDARIQLLDPMLGAIDAPDGAILDGSIGQDTLHTGIGSVNRGATQVLRGGNTQLAGNYYLAITADGTSGASVTLPFSLDVDVTEDPDPGPSYADAANWRVSDQVTALSGGDPTAPGSAQQASSGRSGVSLTSLASGSAGLVLIMTGVTLLMRQRQRRNA